MSLLRRWFDPIRSKWYYNQPQREANLPVDQGISVYLRLDDVYSYLAVQQLEQLEEILVDEIKPLKIIISDQAAPPPNGMSEERWHKYALNDAKTLAMQHRFAYDDMPEMPAREAIAQAHAILERTPLKGKDFLYLLEDVFHMLWQQQYGKLKMLYQMSRNQVINHEPDPQFSFTTQPILTAYFAFGGREYHAVDDLLRLTRRLQQQKLLTSPAIFLINHIEWREHLINDAEDLAEIQALQPELDLYIALEDPISWLLLAYIREELANLYNIQLTIYPLPYQHRDQFDWSLATRLSKRTGVEFTPFCRPDADTVMRMAEGFYQVDTQQRVDALLEMLKQIWTRGKDLNVIENMQNVLKNFDRVDYTNTAEIQAKLLKNDQQCDEYYQPDLPVMVLRVDDRKFVFNSLYRVWMIESIFSNVLEKIAKAQYQENLDDQSS
ncbi:hypothetical protein F4V57_14325 [Acinetobacter qingfengensis]|uniref:Uncharacterized protein n=1 Tax=Acinetobacter qingfengensis TaxID=1262585 RepID=A0A1E7R596_9GAMM|nr:hypothetical protein [Acinetobacter qingfengensis]KAA8730914.1 hypothetical protein F4V57_14325 [Acinetobacter qingfengensis]OEY94488.1 hypothetical protein BJI46_03895 [Acinetobacter qingfengensis]